MVISVRRSTELDPEIEQQFYMTDKILVLTTAGSEAEARTIAHSLVEQKLAACVNIIPRLQSVFRWQGKIEESEEYLLLVKTTADHVTKVRDAIKELHSYDLPECIALPVSDGSEPYLKWIESSL
jgi:periplasmic divalent cation tolerance protein